MPQEKNKSNTQSNTKAIIVAAALVVVVGGGIGALAYVLSSSKTVYIENATVQAPEVDLTPAAPGILNSVSVQVGDTILPGTVVATVGTELITSTQGGLVIAANDNIGKTVTPTDVIVSTIDPTQLRVVGQVQENKGLSDIQVGQRAEFTVDAFGSEKFEGVVDEVSPTAESSDVVFNVSDQREEQNFDVKVRFDTTAYPQIKNGMSAKLWIYKQ